MLEGKKRRKHRIVAQTVNLTCMSFLIDISNGFVLNDIVLTQVVRVHSDSL